MGCSRTCYAACRRQGSGAHGFKSWLAEWFFALMGWGTDGTGCETDGAGWVSDGAGCHADRLGWVSDGIGCHADRF